jgi:hypothetical protein
VEVARFTELPRKALLSAEIPRALFCACDHLGPPVYYVGIALSGSAATEFAFESASGNDSKKRVYLSEEFLHSL